MISKYKMDSMDVTYLVSALSRYLVSKDTEGIKLLALKCREEI